MAIQLRDYQVETLEAIAAAYKKGKRRQLVVLPTGTGKTVIFASLAKRLNVPTLILAHRDELIRQAVEKISLVWPEAAVGVVKAERDESDRQVVVASVQTLARQDRFERLDPQRFRLVIVDESHHVPAISYVKVLEAAGVFPDPGTKLLVGVTATPQRGDGKGLGGVFDEMVYQKSLLDMIRRGYLVDLKAVRVRTRVDLSGVRMVRGDFDERDLALAVNTPERNALVARAYLEQAAGKKAIAFAVDVAHARDLAAAFRQAGVATEFVHGGTPAEERRAILRRLRTGETRVVTNCSVLTEGFDEPSLECIVMARPTRSQGLFVQMAGRVTRTYPGKECGLILDVADATTRHDICDAGVLFGVPGDVLEGRKSAAKAAAEVLEGAAAKALPEGAGIEVQAVDLFNRSRFHWTVLSDRRMELDVAPGERIILLRESYEEDRYRVVLRRRGREDEELSGAIDLGYAQGVAEDYVRQNRREGYASRDAAWRSRPATEKTLALMRGLGLEARRGLTQGEASDLIDEERRRRARDRALADRNAPWRRNPTSPRTRAFLMRLGVPEGEVPALAGDASDLVNRLLAERKTRGGKTKGAARRKSRAVS